MTSGCGARQSREALTGEVFPGPTDKPKEPQTCALPNSGIELMNLLKKC